MPKPTRACPDCDATFDSVNRREFLTAAGAVGVSAALASSVLTTPALAKPAAAKTSETFVTQLYESLSPKQKKEICFDWDHQDPKRGLLRTYISNNWRITKPAITSDYYTADQQALIRGAFEGVLNPDWVGRFDKQLQDDMGGYGKRQGIAIFGKPGDGKFEFVLSGRHGTVRCDGNSTDHVAFGGPIVYGHAASGYYEKPNHPNNVFWHQALAANELYKMLDGKQQKKALLPKAPDEALIAFRAKEASYDGIAVKDLSADQREHLQGVLKKLIEPYRQSDQDEVVAALKKYGGLDNCHLAYYQADDLGKDGIWDNWRLEGPAFVWHYRGAPHVHVWVHVADDPKVALNSKNLSGPLRQKT
jgi:hypothetical protein